MTLGKKTPMDLYYEAQKIINWNINILKLQAAIPHINISSKQTDIKKHYIVNENLGANR